VETGPCAPPDPEEPIRVAEAARGMNLCYVVVTSVTRDDLPDGGAEMFCQTIRALRDRIPGVRVEVLIPDFQGDAHALKMVLDAGPAVLNHNIETVPRLYPQVRPQADYKRSLNLLKQARDYAADIPAKSGLMLGLGESPQEISQTLKDLRSAGCQILTLGQYLQPTPRHIPVYRFVTPEEFENWRQKALGMGFTQAASGPFVRSSYHADTLL
jgi:lipoic acid synthetase